MSLGGPQSEEMAALDVLYKEVQQSARIKVDKVGVNPLGATKDVSDVLPNPALSNAQLINPAILPKSQRAKRLPVTGFPAAEVARAISKLSGGVALNQSPLSANAIEQEAVQQATTASTFDKSGVEDDANPEKKWPPLNRKVVNGRVHKWFENDDDTEWIKERKNLKADKIAEKRKAAEITGAITYSGTSIAREDAYTVKGAEHRVFSTAYVGRTRERGFGNDENERSKRQAANDIAEQRIIDDYRDRVMGLFSSKEVIGSVHTRMDQDGGNTVAALKGVIGNKVTADARRQEAAMTKARGGAVRDKENGSGKLESAENILQSIGISSSPKLNEDYSPWLQWKKMDGKQLDAAKKQFAVPPNPAPVHPEMPKESFWARFGLAKTAKTVAESTVTPAHSVAPVAPQEPKVSFWERQKQKKGLVGRIARLF